MYIKKQTLAILGLSLTAALLLAANFINLPAKADTVVSDRDYQLITARSGNGGEGLYIMDNRTGLLAVFMYDPNVRSLQPRAFTAVANIFGP
jgi:hypothetical protein